MRLASWNVNGLRAVMRRGFLDWMRDADLDVACLQEIKVGQDGLPPEAASIAGYESFFNFARRKGYAGVAVYSRRRPLRVIRDIFENDRFNEEGRALLLEFERFALLNLYLPHGGRDKSNLVYKLQVYEQLLDFLRSYRAKPLIVCGDLNVAHRDADLARPRQNRMNIMFTPEEREAFERIVRLGLADSFRVLHPERSSYSWWPYIANARERNVGWRIDYILVSASLGEQMRGAEMMSQVYGSDHCPVELSIDL